MELFDSAKVKRESFSDVLSYKAFLYLGEKVNEIINLHKNGCTIFYEQSIFSGVFIFRYAEQNKTFVAPVIGVKISDKVTHVWAGDCLGINGGVYFRKKDANRILSSIRYVEPEFFKKLVRKNK